MAIPCYNKDTKREELKAMKKNNIYANLLTEEQKEAFRKGDKHYVSPFKNLQTRDTLLEISSRTTVVYVSTTYARIYEAKQDRIISQQWN